MTSVISFLKRLGNSIVDYCIYYENFREQQFRKADFYRGWY